MLAAQHDFTIEGGARFLRIIQWNDDAGNAVDLTGYTASMRCKYTKEHAVTIFDWGTVSGEIVLGGVNGSITIDVGELVTVMLDFNRAVYNIELTPNGGAPIRILEGSVILSKRI